MFCFCSVFNVYVCVFYLCLHLFGQCYSIQSSCLEPENPVRIFYGKLRMLMRLNGLFKNRVRMNSNLVSFYVSSQQTKVLKLAYQMKIMF